MKSGKQTKTVGEWREAVERIERQVSELDARIADQKSERDGLADQPEKFRASALQVEDLRVERDRLDALRQQAQSGLSTAERLEAEKAEQERRAALHREQTKRLRAAEEIDRALAKVAACCQELEQLNDRCAELGGRGSKRLVNMTAMAAKAAGLRDFLPIATPVKPASMVNQIRLITVNGNAEAVA